MPKQSMAVVTVMQYMMAPCAANTRTERRRVFKSTSLSAIVLLSCLMITILPGNVLSTDDVVFDDESFDSPTHVTTLTVDERGYSDLVVAIRDDVSEEEFPGLLEDLKKALTGASEFMYRATRSLAYFKTVRILLPSTWMNGSDVTGATWERFDISDIRITPAEDNFPYTEKFTGCGLPGKHISLTPDYIVNENVGMNALHDIYGTPNKVIVHEWGHYRWGLFDEYPRHSFFYQDIETDSVEATRCVRAIPGEIRNVRTGEPCGEADYNSDGLPDSSKCVFYDDMAADTYTASIMYKQYLSNNEQFCDDPSLPGVHDSIAHNPMAPNDQNDKCQQRSSWEVLRAHPDFSGTASLDSTPVSSTAPEFIIVRQKPQTTTVLVLDTSGSMDGERLVLLQQAATNIIENVLPIGAKLGIIIFNEYAYVAHDIVEIDSDDARESLLRSLPRVADGRTSIGRGVELAVEILNEAEDDPAGSTLIVITDGEQNSFPYIKDVLGKVETFIVNTVAVGGEADGQLESLAVTTGGDSFSHTDKSSEIYLSFFKAAATQMGTVHNPSQVTDAVIDADFTSISIRETFTNRFYLDDALTGGLKITIAYIYIYNPNDIYFELSRPDGVVYDTFSTPSYYTTADEFKQIKIDLPQDQVIPGQWTLNLTNEASFVDDFNIVIQPRVKNGTTPILATARWAVPSVTPPSRQVLYVIVQQGETPIVNARVNAIVRLNSQTNVQDTVTITPHDDGIGADLTAGDGIYSAYFTNFLGKGRHGVEVQVTAGDDTQIAVGARVGYGAAANPAFSVEDRAVVLEATGEFQREITGGSFECTTTNCGNTSVDLYPPGRITDLALLVENDHVILTFTAPGDDLGDGNATCYEIRVSSNFTQMSKAFETGIIVPPHWFIEGDVTAPNSAGKLEIFHISLNESDETSSLVFGIVAIDEENNRGDRSNLVTFSRPPDTSSRHNPQAGLPPGAIAGLTLSILLLLLCLLVVGVLYYMRRWRSAPSKSAHAQCNGNHTAMPVQV